MILRSLSYHDTGLFDTIYKLEHFFLLFALVLLQVHRQHSSLETALTNHLGDHLDGGSVSGVVQEASDRPLTSGGRAHLKGGVFIIASVGGGGGGIKSLSVIYAKLMSGHEQRHSKMKEIDCTYSLF